MGPCKGNNFFDMYDKSLRTMISAQHTFSTDFAVHLTKELAHFPK